MKVVILAGGLGTRLSKETTVKPKPMVEMRHINIIINVKISKYSFIYK
jgi:glucose-1-phosphate cytidylyltransferase